MLEDLAFTATATTADEQFDRILKDLERAQRKATAGPDSLDNKLSQNEAGLLSTLARIWRSAARAASKKLHVYSKSTTSLIDAIPSAIQAAKSALASRKNDITNAIRNSAEKSMVLGGIDGKETEAISSSERTAADIIARRHARDILSYPERVLEPVITYGATKLAEQGADVPEILAKIDRHLDNTTTTLSLSVRNSSRLSFNLSRLGRMKAGGETKFQIWNPMDDRTSPICQLMFGQTISISDADRTIQDYLDADSSDDERKAKPFLGVDKDGEVYTYANGSKLYLPGGIDTTRNKALWLPPYHGDCRSIALPIG